MKPQTEYGRTEALKEVEATIESAHRHGHHNAMVKALELKAKLLGLLDPQPANGPKA